MTTLPSPRFLVRLTPGRWRAVELEEVYCVEAAGDDCRVRLRERDPLVDVRRLSELKEHLRPFGFVRIHRSVLVNPAAGPGAAAAKRSPGLEAVMEPPVNRVLAVSEERLGALHERFA